MNVHPFVASPHTTHDRKPICESCGHVQDRPVHAMPERHPEEVAVEARRVGEAP